MNEIKEYTEKVFEDIKHIDKKGNEYWLARKLQNVLGYHQWRSINDLIERAKTACQESKYNADDHFAVQRKMIKLAKGATRNVADYKLSRYACYLIVMNGNPKKEIIALAQTDAKLKRDNVDNEYTANSVHFEVGKEVRNSIKRLGGTMPENLPTPERSLKEIEKENKKIGYEKL